MGPSPCTSPELQAHPTVTCPLSHPSPDCQHLLLPLALEALPCFINLRYCPPSPYSTLDPNHKLGREYDPMYLQNFKKPLDRMNSVSQADSHVRVHPVASMLMVADDIYPTFSLGPRGIGQAWLLSGACLCYVDTDVRLCEVLVVLVSPMSLRFKDVMYYNRHESII